MHGKIKNVKKVYMSKQLQKRINMPPNNTKFTKKTCKVNEICLSLLLHC